jgi:peptidyl-prolyl cis-trans isomerase C
LNRAPSRHAVALAAALSVSVAYACAAPAQNQPQNQPQGQPPAAPAAAQQPAAAAQGQAPAQPKSAVDPNKVVLTVGDQKVTAGEVEALVSDLPARQQQLLQQAGKRMLAEELVRIKLLAQEAQKRKLDQEPKTRRQLELTRDQILAGAVASDVLREQYSQNKEKYEKIRARHILIRTPGSRVPVRPGQKELTDAEAKAKAEDLRKQIQGGADFGELARKESDDTGSGARGGDLDVFGHGMMVPEFDKAAFALKKGEVSEPVKTQFGYHIIQVTDILTFDELQQDIASQNSPQIQKMVEDLRKNANVQIDESYFGPAPAPRPAQGVPGAPGAQPPAPQPQGNAQGQK